MEVDCATKKVVRAKPAYRAVQSLTAIVDGNVTRPEELEWLHDGDRHITRADASRGVDRLVFLWVNNVPPLGNTTFSDAVEVEVDLTHGVHQMPLRVSE